jgi:hypothetical protein
LTYLSEVMTTPAAYVVSNVALIIGAALIFYRPKERLVIVGYFLIIVGVVSWICIGTNMRERAGISLVDFLGR